MKSFKIAFIIYFITINYCQAQDSIVILTPKMFEANQQIFLSNMKGWIYKSGNDIQNANVDAPIIGWKKKSPFELSVKEADKNGKVEAWFRIKIKLDSAFNTIPLAIRKGSWAAMDVYIDGKLFQTYGNTGKDGQSYKESNPYILFPIPVNMTAGKIYTVAIHLVDYRSSITPWELKSLTHDNCLRIVGPEYSIFLRDYITNTLFYKTLAVGICSVILLFFIIFLYQNPKQKNLKIYTFAILIFTLQSISQLLVNKSFITNSFDRILSDFINVILLLSVLFIMFSIATLILKNKIYKLIYWVFIIFLITTIFAALRLPNLPFISRLSEIIVNVIGIVLLLFLLYLIFSSLKKLKDSQRIILMALISLILIIGLSFLTQYFGISNISSLVSVFITTFFPISLLIYISTLYKETTKVVEEKAKALSENIKNLKDTQSQLIQSEKMASLGELTAGIAHEIQNPLNFVNNFSEVSNELIVEMTEEIDKGDFKEVKEIATDIKQNLKKINHHGKRASSIVKGMLDHSRTSNGVKELSDINVLADEYLRLAYHGLRAKDKNFNANFKTDLDKTIPKISLIPQDFSRVILNLINNAFYAVSKKGKENLEEYQPTVTLITKKVGNTIQISVKDNGNGIPKKVLNKIFQPFFTTKPTGEGTGLGLSLSYDIIKAHGGELKVETKEGEGTVFTIVLKEV